MAAEQVYGFGPFTLLRGRQQLLRDGAPVALGSRAFELLSALVEADGALVPKRALFDRIWPNAVVEESNLTVTVSTLRKALGCGTDGTRYVATIPGRGYRLAVPVERPDRPAPATAPTAGATGRGNLPRPLSRLIGREAELARIRTLLDERPLVTVTGPGGVGKTRLALAAGALLEPAFADGVWQVELAPVAAPELVAEAVAALFGLAVPVGRPVESLLVSFLKRKRLLLIFDNCEHLVAAVARVSQTILEGCPELAILATSREPLGLAGEQVLSLPPLAVPERTGQLAAAEAMRFDAIRLFVDRAGMVHDGFALDDGTAPTVAEICRRLDGIALAIELAVPRLRLLDPAGLLAGLDHRFRLLAGGHRTAQPRQQTLRAMVDWSHTLLSEEERALFRRLALFGGSFSLEAVAAVTAVPPLQSSGLVALLAGLVDKSLVAVVPGPDGAVRYRLLETIRAFARERLEEAGEAGLSERLARWLIDHFTAASEAWQTAATEPWLARYEPEIDNLRSGLEWAFGAHGDSALGLALLSQVDELLLELSLLLERRRWLEIGIARLGPGTPDAIAGRIRLALAFSGAYGLRRDLDAGREAVEALRRAGDPLWLGAALRHLGALLARPGETEEAEALLAEAEALLRPLGPTLPLSALLGTIGAVRYLRGAREGARAAIEEALAMARRMGFRRGIQVAGMSLAELDCVEGRLDEAIERAREAVAACRASGNVITLSYVLTNLTGYLVAAGRVAEARAVGREAVQLDRALENDRTKTICLEHLARAAALAGDLPLAARLAGYGDAYYRAGAQPRHPNEQTAWLALTEALEQGLDDAARRALMAEGARWREDEAIAAALAD